MNEGVPTVDLANLPRVTAAQISRDRPQIIRRVRADAGDHAIPGVEQRGEREDVCPKSASRRQSADAVKDWLLGTLARPGLGSWCLDPGRLMRPASVAEAYWQIYQEPPDAWSFEREIRPYAEKW